MTYHFVVGRRNVIKGAVAGLVGVAALGVAGCDSDANYSDADMAKRFLEEQWGVNLPDGAKLEDYYSSESDFQGGRDDVYVLEIPEDGSTGFWEAGKYKYPLNKEAKKLARSIVKSSEAPFGNEKLAALKCRKVMEDGQDSLLPCYDSDTGRFVMFERIF